MALSQRQYAVLAEMGIPVWERRYSEVSVGTDMAEPDNAETLKADDAPHIELLGRCVVVVPALPLAESEQKLFAAMLRTISLPLEQVDLLDEKAFERLTSESLHGKPLWSIGTSGIDGGYYCDSLTTLLTEPQRKTMAWQVLKQLAQQLK